MNANELFDLIRRDAVGIYSEDGLRDKLQSGRRLKIKLGADPSRPDLHLGHSVVLRKLKCLQEAGHEVIFVIGDFTGMIGDPSGRSKTRPPLTFEQTRQNGQTYLAQVGKILDPQKTRVVYNSEWLSGLRLADTLGLMGKATLAQILERDDFANRYATRQTVGLHELLYPLLQGYDSVALEADIEVGGTDQTFNLLMGRALQREYGQPPQDVITFPLLPGLDGEQKMSKSLDNYIGIDEPAEIMFAKCMRVPDTLLADYVRLTADVTEVPDDVRAAHLAYARAIVAFYHGENAVAPAERRYKTVAGGGAPDTMPVVTVGEGEASLVSLLVRAGLAGSLSDARRLIEGRGVKLDGETATEMGLVIRRDCVLQRGKNGFARVTFI